VAPGRNAAFDLAMPRLSTAANHSALWLALAAGIGAIGGRRGRRAALRGVLAVAGASSISSGFLERLLPRRRPPLAASSMPSGHATSAAAFATAVSIEFPELAVPLGALAAAVAYSRVYNGVHYPADVLLGGAIGIGVAVATTKVWPRADYSPASARPVPATLARITGEAVGRRRRAHHRRQPRGPIGSRRRSGRGSPRRTPGRTLEHDCPLVVVPGGTLNHFARDLGLESVEDAVRAVESGQLVAVDVGTIDGRPFVNTASFGSYSKLVEAREQLEDSIGKWPALVVALVRILRDADPFEFTIDGRPRRIWTIFVGNCAYDPPGFAPATRVRLDDGVFDVRIIDGSEPWARVRLIVAALTGNLARSKVHTRRLVSSMTLRSSSDDNLLAADGEIFRGRAGFTVEKHPQRLLVYAPK
jgi:diacylglycerol kinase family enzyme/membrane-associated phospholipid phosphatase